MWGEQKTAYFIPAPAAKKIFRLFACHHTFSLGNIDSNRCHIILPSQIFLSITFERVCRIRGRPCFHSGYTSMITGRIMGERLVFL